MRLELKDVESSMVYTVDGSGAVLGRERARTDINFRDESISKRHARIYAEDETWYIEDLGSSNGTFVHDQRINEPVVITRGSAFTLAQRRFEVVFIEGTGGSASASATAELGDEERDDVASSEELEAKGIGAIFLAVPKAVAHYLVSVPLMAVNPLGAIRSSVETQRNPAMTRGELAAFGLVALGVTALLQSLFGILAGLIRGHFSVGLLVSALPGAAIAAAGGAVGGFVLHPVLGWLVHILKGRSTPRSRTNYALDLFTLSILVALPNGVASLIHALPLPFPGLVPIVLSLLVSLLGVFVAYRWALAFEVMAAVRYLIIGLGVASVLSSAWLAVKSILDSPTAATAADLRVDPDLQALSEKALEQAEQAAERAADPGAPTQGASADTTAIPAGAARTTAPGEGTATDGAEGPNEGGRPAEDGSSAEGRAPGSVNETTRSDSRSEEGTRERGVSSAQTQASSKRAVLDAEHPRGETDFVLFVRQRAAIERAIADDPSLLNRKDVLDDYEDLWRVTYDVRDRWRRLAKKQPRWKQDKILARKEELQVFKRTRRLVDSLYGTLFSDE